ncbi:DUF6414 family protein [Herbaspirillum huttiense]
MKRWPKNENNSKETLIMAQESQSTDFVLDFLYVDFDRIKSWLAQLVVDGVPTGHKKTSTSGEAASKEVSGAIEAAANASVLFAKSGIKGLASGKVSAAENLSSSLERSFDAYWSLPINFLNKVDEVGLLQRNISKADIGSLVLVSGSPVVMDMKFLQDVWAPGTEFMLSQRQPLKPNNQHKAAANQEREQMRMVGSLLKVVPPAPQLVLKDDGGAKVWASLKENHMIVNTSALALTHGVDISGKWGVLAVLDAIPDGQKASDRSGNFGTGLMNAAGELLTALRDMMGRPTDAYGVTPVLIYRLVNGET